MPAPRGGSQDFGRMAAGIDELLRETNKYTEDEPTKWRSHKAILEDEDEEMSMEKAILILVCFWFFCAALWRLSCGRGKWCGLGCCVRRLSCGVCCKKGSSWQTPAEPVVADPAQQEVDTVLVDGVQLHVDHLLQKKDISTAYLLLFGAGFVGAHHFYLGRLAHGVLAAATLNFFGVGWSIDMMILPVYVKWFNDKTARFARSDRSCGRICWRVPVAFCCWLVVLVSGYLLIPRGIHEAGLVDIDAAMAKTTRNPYEILGIQPDIDYQRAVQAYQKETLRLQAECSTSKTITSVQKCKKNAKDLKNAHEFVKRKLVGKTSTKKAERKPVKGKKGLQEDEPADYFDNAAEEWKTLGNIVYAKGKPTYDKVEAWLNVLFTAAEETPDSTAEAEEPTMHYDSTHADL